jgi:hypothetical protein
MEVVGTGDDGAAIEVRFTAADEPPTGAQRTEGALTTYVWHERPFDWLPWALGGAVGLALVATAAWFLWRASRDRRDRRRLARVT